MECMSKSRGTTLLFSLRMLRSSQIVTGYLDSAARNLGHTEQPEVRTLRVFRSYHNHCNVEEARLIFGVL